MAVMENHPTNHMEQKTNAIEITQSLTVTGVAILFAVLRVGNASTLNGYKITVKLLFKSYFMAVVVLFSTQASSHVCESWRSIWVWLNHKYHQSNDFSLCATEDAASSCVVKSWSSKRSHCQHGSHHHRHRHRHRHHYHLQCVRGQRLWCACARAFHRCFFSKLTCAHYRAIVRDIVVAVIVAFNRVIEMRYTHFAFSLVKIILFFFSHLCCCYVLLPSLFFVAFQRFILFANYFYCSIYEYFSVVFYFLHFLLLLILYSLGIAAWFPQFGKQRQWQQRRQQQHKQQLQQQQQQRQMQLQQLLENPCSQSVKRTIAVGLTTRGTTLVNLNKKYYLKENAI